MATKTTNLDLNKPAGSDIVDIDVLNQNMDILDETVGNVQGIMNTVREDLTTVQEDIETAKEDISAIEDQIPDIKEYADSAAENAEKSETYYYLSRMQAATGGFLHLENENGYLYCVRTSNCDVELIMEEGVLYYAYSE